MAQEPNGTGRDERFELPHPVNTGQGVFGKSACQVLRIQELRQAQSVFFEAQAEENLYEDRTLETECEDLQVRVMDGQPASTGLCPDAGPQLASPCIPGKSTYPKAKRTGAKIITDPRVRSVACERRTIGHVLLE